MVTPVSVAIAVLAHNEERRIAACLDTLPLGEAGVAIHVLVNGATDRTAAIARGFARAGNVTVHDFAQGGKARTWNRYIHDLGVAADTHVFVDGDAQVVAGSIPALVRALAAAPDANAAAALPHNGRHAARYRADVIDEHGLFGDLYALPARFVARLRQTGTRLPEDLIGDDGLVGAFAKTDLGDERDWRDARVLTVREAGFLCEPTSLLRPRTLRVQYRRMIAYSMRHFQNRIISQVMAEAGPAGLPPRLAALYPRALPGLAPRRSPALWWFDRQALARLRAAN
jgi:hypothetical protein